MSDRSTSDNQEPSPEVDRLAREVIGSAIEVHRCLGPGFLEFVYEEALAIELRARGIAYERQVVVRVNYKGHAVGEGRIDLFVEDQLVVELKTVEGLLPIHTAQVISYLKTTRRRLGLLISFNVPVLKDGIKRVACS